MENLKKEILQEFKEYWNKEDNLLEQNKQYFDTEKYTEEFIENKKAELNRSKETYRKMSSEKFEKIGNDYIKSLKVDTDTINTLEYQTKLSNTLKLLELNNGHISKENIDFMVKAGDTQTLSILNTKYQSKVLKEAFNNSNADYLKDQAEQLIYQAKLNLHDFMGKPRNRNDVMQYFR